MALQPTMSECALAVHERYLLQVRHCQQQAERQARLIGGHVPPHVDAPADLIQGYAAICAQVGMSPPTLRRRLRRGDVPVYRVWSDAGPLVCCVRRADLPKLRRGRAHS
jgi:hypothetical protein